MDLPHFYYLARQTSYSYRKNLFLHVSLSALSPVWAYHSFTIHYVAIKTKRLEDFSRSKLYVLYKPPSVDIKTLLLFLNTNVYFQIWLLWNILPYCWVIRSVAVLFLLLWLETSSHLSIYCHCPRNRSCSSINIWFLCRTTFPTPSCR